MPTTARSAFRTEWRPLVGLAGDAALRTEWDALAERAVEPNVFYTPAVALACAPLYGHGVGAVLVRDAGGRLAGLFPLRASRTRWGVPIPVLIGWTHPFAPLGTPLVDPADPQGVVAATLDHLARKSATTLLLPYLADNGPVAVALGAVLIASGRRMAIFDRHARAELVRPASPDAGPAVVDPRRKEHARQRRRLAERGTLTFDLTAGEATVAALADFLDLEASGWKGTAGTAAIASPAQRALIETAVAGLAAEGHASIARLRLDGRTVAAGIVLASGGGTWFWKTAYDETLAKFSPGVLLALDLSDALLRDARITVVDSCAVAGHPMIDRLWADRRVLSDRLIALRPGGAGFTLAYRLEGLRRAAIATAKAARDRLRR
ncbi:MAG: GNAT family N-acetyltransferase [Rhodoplanes sp.]|uniref:GNAT family N-acetyltransferase n=1 Tax=Rhodoplanes sp. TaxID=1968906 RepID=UPI0018173EC2|nr:GNAT family N-acetyltransferase [Rhodoplanes sp.]NVO12840.1 GNAT family N-acetyltransferase [Rhodoplanes sp.]